LTDDQKQVYQDISNVGKERYEQEKRAYLEGKANAGKDLAKADKIVGKKRPASAVQPKKKAVKAKKGKKKAPAKKALAVVAKVVKAVIEVKKVTQIEEIKIEEIIHVPIVVPIVEVSIQSS
jgi:hypothetical protein